jgi:2'-5' RNA ligase
MDDGSARVFTALWPDAAVRTRLAVLRDAWRWPEGVRPVADANLHLTLHYLGAFARARLFELEERLTVLPAQRMRLHADVPEIWRGGIAVLRVAVDPALVALHEGIGGALASLGVALDARPFAPHVTMARRARGAVAPAAPAALEWPARSFVLVESVTGPEPCFRVLRSFGDAGAVGASERFTRP